MDRKICYYLKEVDDIIKGEVVYPVTCEIDLSNHCQNKCSFCVNDEYIQSNRVHLGTGRYLTLLKEFLEVGVKSLTFTGGGEPTCHPDFRRIIEISHEKGFQLGLVTNGHLLDKYADLAHMFQFIRVSLDAATPETYKKIKKVDRFKKVISNVKKIVGKCETVGLSFVVCDDNQHEIEQAKELAKELDVTYLQVKSAILKNRLRDLAHVSDNEQTVVTPRYEIEDDYIACHIAGLVGIIGADGKVYYCCIHRGKKEFIIGDIYKETFKELWKKRRHMKPDISKCDTCRYMNYAQGYKKFRDPKYTYLRHKYFL